MKQHRYVPRVISATALAIIFGATAAHAGGNKADTSGHPASGESMATSGGAVQQQGASASGGTHATTGAQQTGVGELNQQDQQILRDIAQANLAEIRTSQLALERSQDPQIRQYAQRLIEDHETLQQRVQYLARVKDVPLPQQPSQAQQQTAKQLAQLQGEEFDRAYRKQMGVQAHKKTHDMLRASQVKAEDPQLIAMITQAMPVIEQHLNLAQKMPADQTGAGAASGGQAQEATGTSGSASMTEGASAAEEEQTPRDTSSAVEGTTGAESISAPTGSSNMQGPGK